MEQHLSLIYNFHQTDKRVYFSTIICYNDKDDDDDDNDGLQNVVRHIRGTLYPILPDAASNGAVGLHFRTL